jgi:hypothetical protein
MVIPLTQGKSTVIDDEDWELVAPFRWSLIHEGNRVSWHVVARWPDGPTKFIKMHRLILGLPPERPFVDHVDCDGLNNRRSNLRIATRQQNSSNRDCLGNKSGFKGVFQNGKSWTARIRFNKRLINLGTFPDPTDAARRYDIEAMRLFGEFARPNFAI